MYVTCDDLNAVFLKNPFYIYCETAVQAASSEVQSHQA